MKIQNEPIDWHLSIGHETNKLIKVEKNKSNTYLITILPRSPSIGMPKVTEAIYTKAADAIWLRAVDNSTARNISINSGETGGQRAKQWGQGPGPVVGPVVGPVWVEVIVEVEVGVIVGVEYSYIN